MEIGYASGYTSAFTGRRMLVREVECRAMGHVRCRSIVKPVEDWDDPESDLKYLLATPARAAQANYTVRANSHGSGKAVSKSQRGTPPLPDRRADNVIVGASNALNNILHRISRVAPTHASVLMLGESGVGKSLLAREIHACSQRASEKSEEHPSELQSLMRI